MAVKEKENNLGMLPQNIEAEEAVLGAILVNPNVITKVVEVLKPRVFINLLTDIYMMPCYSYLILMKELISFLFQMF